MLTHSVLDARPQLTVLGTLALAARHPGFLPRALARSLLEAAA